MIAIGDDAGLDPNSSSEIGERWSNFGCIFKVLMDWDEMWKGRLRRGQQRGYVVSHD